MTTDSRGRRPYTTQAKVRIAISFAVLATGLLLVSTPGWLFTESSNRVTTNAVVGFAGALIGFAVTSFVNEIFDPTYDAVMEAFDLHSDRDNRTGFLNAIREEVVESVARVTATPADFGPRAEMVQKLGLGQAKDHVMIQSISLSQKWHTAQTLEELFRAFPEMTVRVLLIHPYSKNANARERDLGFSTGTMRQLVQESILPLASLKAQDTVQDRLQVRGYWAIPYFGIVSVDSVKTLVTLSREGRGGDQNYAFLIHGSMPSTTAMIADLEKGFEERWASSHDLMQELKVELSPAGSPTSSDGSLVIALRAPVKLLAESIRVKVDNGILVGEVEEAGPEVHIRLKSHGSGIMRLQVLEALSQDMNHWLSKPVELSMTVSS